MSVHYRHDFTEAMIELSSDNTDCDGLMVDGEPAANTSKVYFKVHGGYLSFFGTGKIEGHPKPAGAISPAKLKGGFICLLFTVFTVIFLIFVGLGYLISYLANL